MTRNMMAHWNALQRKLAGVHGPDANAWQPNTDVYESPDGLIVKVELGGVPCDQIHIYLQEAALVVEGMRRDPHSGESVVGLRLRQMEIEYGPFQRIVAIPFPVAGNEARAHLNNGVLKIRLPRAKAPAPTKITVMMDG